MESLIVAVAIMCQTTPSYLSKQKDQIKCVSKYAKCLKDSYKKANVITEKLNCFIQPPDQSVRLSVDIKDEKFDDWMVHKEVLDEHNSFAYGAMSI